mgnify:CR=1 FL=1
MVQEKTRNRQAHHNLSIKIVKQIPSSSKIAAISIQYTYKKKRVRRTSPVELPMNVFEKLPNGCGSIKKNFLEKYPVQLKWINKFSMEIDIPISAVDSHYDPDTGKFLLLIGDEKGEVKIQDITAIITHYDLKPVDIVTGDPKRNPTRYKPIENYSLDSAVEDGDNQSEMET